MKRIIRKGVFIVVVMAVGAACAEEVKTEELWERYEESQRFYRPLEMDPFAFRNLSNVEVGGFVFGATNSNNALVEGRKTIERCDKRLSDAISFDCETAIGSNRFIEGWVAKVNANFTCQSKRLYAVNLWFERYDDETIAAVIRYLSAANGGELFALDETVGERVGKPTDKRNAFGRRRRKSDRVGLPPTARRDLTKLKGANIGRYCRCKTRNRINITIFTTAGALHVSLSSPDFHRLAELESEWKKSPTQRDLKEMSEEDLLTQFLQPYCQTRSLYDSVLCHAESNGVRRTFDIGKYACDRPPEPFIANGRSQDSVMLLIPTEKDGRVPDLRSEWNVFACGAGSSCKTGVDIEGNGYWLGYVVGVNGVPYFIHYWTPRRDYKYAKVEIYDCRSRPLTEREELIAEELLSRIDADSPKPQSSRDVLIEKCLRHLSKLCVSTNDIMNVGGYVDMAPRFAKRKDNTACKEIVGEKGMDGKKVPKVVE